VKLDARAASGYGCLNSGHERNNPMPTSEPVIDLRPIISINEASLDHLEIAIEKCRNGQHRSDRASTARYLLVEEARAIVQGEISRRLEFDPSQLSGYVALFPDILDFDVSEGPLGAALEIAVKRAVEESVMDDAYRLLLTQREDRSLDTLARDVAEIQNDLLGSINGVSHRRLSHLVEEALEARDGVNLMQICEELDHLAQGMRGVIHRLDIADPPTADVAGKARRLLLEASDSINLAVAFENMDEFLTPSAKAAP
jgi:hypothetical protein